MLASLIMSVFYLTMFSSGNIGALDFGITMIAAVLTAGGAALGRHAWLSKNSTGA